MGQSKAQNSKRRNEFGNEKMESLDKNFKDNLSLNLITKKEWHTRNLKWDNNSKYFSNQ